MNNLFVAPDGRAHGRWQEAFGEPQVVVGLAAAGRRLQAGDLLWLLGQRLSAVREFVSATPDVRVIVMSLRPTREEAMQAFDAGARGYCHALATPGLLTDIATVVQHGGLWIGPELMGETIRALQYFNSGVAPESLWEHLTDREREVGRWIVQGASNREIAAQLKITERTVKAHLAAMFDKLEVRDRLQLAIKLGQAPESSGDP